MNVHRFVASIGSEVGHDEAVVLPLDGRASATCDREAHRSTFVFLDTPMSWDRSTRSAWTSNGPPRRLHTPSNCSNQDTSRDPITTSTFVRGSIASRCLRRMVAPFRSTTSPMAVGVGGMRCTRAISALWTQASTRRGRTSPTGVNDASTDGDCLAAPIRRVAAVKYRYQRGRWSILRSGQFGATCEQLFRRDTLGGRRWPKRLPRARV